MVDFLTGRWHVAYGTKAMGICIALHWFPGLQGLIAWWLSRALPPTDERGSSTAYIESSLVAQQQRTHGIWVSAQNMDLSLS